MPKQIPAAAVPEISSLICYCSIAAVACIWYIDLLPPTLFGVSCRCKSLGCSCACASGRGCFCGCGYGSGLGRCRRCCCCCSGCGGDGGGGCGCCDGRPSASWLSCCSSSCSCSNLYHVSDFYFFLLDLLFAHLLLVWFGVGVPKVS